LCSPDDLRLIQECLPYQNIKICAGERHMKNYLIYFVVLYFYIPHPILAQLQLPQSSWEFVGVFPDSTSVTRSAHGLAVDNDNKVWIGQYYPIVTVNEDLGDLVEEYIGAPLYIYHADGTPADFSPIYRYIIDGDTLIFGPITGLNRDHEGNILLATHGMWRPPKGDQFFGPLGGAFILKIDAKTGELIAYRDVTIMRTSLVAHAPNRPAVITEGDGVGWIVVIFVWEDSPFLVISPNLSSMGELEAKRYGFSRSLEISPDGVTMYVPGFSNNYISLYQSDIFFSYEHELLPDTTLANGMYPGSISLDPTNPNILWVAASGGGNDPLPEESPYYGHSDKIFAIDLTTREIVDFLQWDSPEYQIPRSMAFSPDGSTLYVGTFTLDVPAVHKFSRVTGVQSVDREFAETIQLLQNYPNPFNPSTTIQFSIPSTSPVRLEIYNVLGQRVRTLVNEEMLHAGVYNVTWNGRDEHNRVVSSGMYVYRITSGGFVASKSMLFLK
jgi:hypothetical protein